MSERAGECVEGGGRDVGGLVRRWMEDYMFHLASGKTRGKGKAVVLGKVVLTWKLCFFSQRDSSVVQVLPDEWHDWPCCGYHRCI